MFFSRRRSVLVYIDLVQDLDVLAPVLLALKRDGRWPLTVRVARWLAEASPRTGDFLDRHRLAFRYVRRSEVVAGAQPSLHRVAALLTASESSAEAHAACHALAARAAQSGVPSFTLQHGLESSGLQLGDGMTFSSDKVFTWAAPPLGALLAPETQAKLVPVGRPIPVLENAPAAPACELGVFENLHWDRYRDAERDAFMACLLGLADRRPELAILVRAHPAAGWLDAQAAHFQARPNISYRDSRASRRDPSSGSEIVRQCRRVITTPSTIALDAAQAGRAVALALPGSAIYAPLPVLNSVEDWASFSQTQDLNPAKNFAAGTVLSGDAIARIVDVLASEIEA